MRTFALAFGASAVLLAGTASAHFKMVMPPSPTPSEDGKGAPPCGPDTGEGTVTSVMGGSQLALSVNETVRHGGFYRAALALKSCKTAGCFPADNKVYDSSNMLLAPTGPGNSDHADVDPAPKFPILADGLFPHPQASDGTGPVYAGMITIPNVACDKCTLQVIEFMAPHGPNGAAGYFYHHCADLKIAVDPGKPVFDPGGGSGGTGSGGSGSGGSAGLGGAPSAGGAATAGQAATAGGAGTNTGGTPTGTGGAPTGTSGTSTTAAGTSTTGTSGTGTTTTGGSGSLTPPCCKPPQDDSGCGIGGRAQGGATALAALGLLLTLVRRRRAS